MKPTDGVKNLEELIANMEPILNEGAYVFASVSDLSTIPRDLTICEIKEKEGITIVLSQSNAEKLGLAYSYVASWITLNIHSSLEAVGLTAAFATALGQNNVSCNVVAGYYHDHIFVDQKDQDKAMRVLQQMSKKN